MQNPPDLPSPLRPCHRPGPRKLNSLKKKFPYDPTFVREGAGTSGIPSNARWTKISPALADPEALEEGGERYEERDGTVR